MTTLRFLRNLCVWALLGARVARGDSPDAGAAARDAGIVPPPLLARGAAAPPEPLPPVMVRSVEGVVNLNQAATEELRLLSGIGPAKIRAIMIYRQAHPFRTVEELVRIKGIGRKMLKRLRPHLAVSGPTTAQQVIRPQIDPTPASGVYRPPVVPSALRRPPAPVPPSPVGVARRPTIPVRPASHRAQFSEADANHCVRPR